MYVAMTSELKLSNVAVAVADRVSNKLQENILPKYYNILQIPCVKNTLKSISI